MSTPKHTVGGVTFFGETAKIAAQITNEEWSYFKLVDGLSDMIAVYMQDRDMKKSDLARKLGKSRAFVSKVLAGDAHNMTLKTLSSLIYNLDARLEYKVVSNDEIFRWIGVSHNRQIETKPQLKEWSFAHSPDFCGGSFTTSQFAEKESLAA